MNMAVGFNFNNFTNLLVIVWVASILFRNAIYQISTLLIIVVCISILFRAESRFQAITALKNVSLFLFASSTVVVTSLISNLHSDYLNDGILFEQTKMVLRYGGTLIALYILQTCGYINLRLLVKAVTAILMVVGINGIVQLTTGTGLLGQALFPDGTVTSFFENPNPFGLISLLFSAVTLYIISVTDGLSKAFTIALHAFSLYCLLLSGSRAPLLAYFALLSIFILFHEKKIQLSIGSIFLAVVLILIHPPFLESLKSIINLEDSNRFDIWIWTIQESNNNWLLGHGLSAFKLMPTAPDYGFIHNSILDLYFHYGILGVLSHGLLFLVCMIYAFRQPNKIILSLGCSLFVLSLFDYSPTSGKLFLSVITLYLFFLIVKTNQLITTTSLTNDK